MIINFYDSFKKSTHEFLYYSLLGIKLFKVRESFLIGNFYIEFLLVLISGVQCVIKLIITCRHFVAGWK